IAGIVLVDADGRPVGIVPRLDLLRSMSGGGITRGAQTAPAEPPSVTAAADAPNKPGSPDQPAPNELMVSRYGLLHFPAEPPLGDLCPLVIEVRSEPPAGGAQPVELGLTARAWPLKVLATLVGVRAEDFLVQGESSQIITVPRTGDASPVTFTLIPQSTG